MDKESNYDGLKKQIDPIKWCSYIVNVGYVTAALMILAHVIWCFAARNVLVHPLNIYLRNYIVFPAICLFALNFSVDMFVRSPRFSLFVKEYLSLSLFVIFSFYLSITHDIARVLLGSFILPIFVSTIFSNVKITRLIFWMSNIALLLLGVKKYFTGTIDSNMVMQIFVACFMFFCSYLLAKILIRYGHDNLSALINFESQQRFMQKQLKLDPFTGLYNRKTFDEDLIKFMGECRSSNKCLSLAMIDVDHFKCVNDLYGHAAGDQVLLYLANILKGIQAENIHAFRIGGEEFAILFMDCDTEEAYHICEGIRINMGSASLRDIDKRKVTLSCGLICKNPNNISPEMFTTAADSALYSAKNNGRNQVVIYNDYIQHIKRNKDNIYTS